MDQIGIWATVAISGVLLVEKLIMRLNLYDGVQSLHLNCSRCCDVDIQRTEPPIALLPPPTASPPPEPAPSRNASRNATPTIDELMRRVSVAIDSK